jgi:hypothetical protein
MSTALPAVYVQLESVLSADDGLRDYLRSLMPDTVANWTRARVWLGDTMSGTPFGFVNIAEPNEAARDYFDADGNEGRVRITSNTTPGPSFLAVARVYQELDRVLRLSGPFDLSALGHRLIHSSLECVTAFKEPDGKSYRGVYDFRFMTVKT